VSLLALLAGYAIWRPMPPQVGSILHAFGVYDSEALVGNFLLTYALACVGYLALAKARFALRVARVGLLTGVLIVLAGMLELPALTGFFDYRELFYPRIPGSLGSHNRVYQPGIAFSRPAHDEFESVQLGGAAIHYRLVGHRRYRARHRYDARGYRNTRDLEKADVVLIGDSFLEGPRVDQDVIVSEVLGERLGVPVASFGQSDYGPVQELQVMRKLALGLEPRIVVWFFYEGNDVVFLEHYGERLALTIQDEERFVRRSFTLNALDYLIRAANLNALGSQGDRRWASWIDAAGQRERIYFTAAGSPPSSNREAALESVLRVLKAARRDAHAAGARFLLAFVPMKLRVYRDLVSFPPDSESQRWKLDDLPQRLGAWAQQNSIPYLDLTRPLFSAAEAGALVYLADDAHWSPEGHRVAADHVAATLRPWLNEGGGR
jgi:hypothetical protein